MSRVWILNELHLTRENMCSRERSEWCAFEDCMTCMTDAYMCSRDRTEWLALEYWMTYMTDECPCSRERTESLIFATWMTWIPMRNYAHKNVLNDLHLNTEWFAFNWWIELLTWAFGMTCNRVLNDTQLTNEYWCSRERSKWLALALNDLHDRWVEVSVLNDLHLNTEYIMACKLLPIYSPCQ
jgi:hypothetical protein